MLCILLLTVPSGMPVISDISVGLPGCKGQKHNSLFEFAQRFDGVDDIEAGNNAVRFTVVYKHMLIIGNRGGGSLYAALKLFAIFLRTIPHCPGF